MPHHTQEFQPGSLQSGAIICDSVTRSDAMSGVFGEEGFYDEYDRIYAEDGFCGTFEFVLDGLVVCVNELCSADPQFLLSCDEVIQHGVESLLGTITLEEIEESENCNFGITCTDSPTPFPTLSPSEQNSETDVDPVPLVGLGVLSCLLLLCCVV